MSKKTYNKSNVRHRSLNGSGQKYKSASSLKATNTTYVKTTKKSTRPKQTVQASAAAAGTAAAQEAVKAAAKTTAKTTANTTAKKAADTAKAAKTEKPARSLLEPAFLNRKGKPDSTATAKKGFRHNYRWSMIIPAIAVILCLALFVVASQAGWIQTFLTPESRRLVKEATSTEPETTTTQKETETTTEKPTKETTTKETTTEYIPSVYVINVNLGYNRVTVYSRGEKLNDGYDPKDPHDDEYDLIPEIAFTCSPGLDATTPTGTFYLQNRTTWCLMIHDVYTQYATRIVDDVMFHSIPYLSENPGDLATYDYNILGQDASAACIRLNVRDAAWIFNNCAEGTEVNIFYDYTWPGPIDPEPTYQIPEDLEPLSGWDPTDVYSGGNPWLTYEAYLASQDVTLPCYSAPDTLIAMLSPTDDYGNNLAPYFHTDGGYDLTTPGTYETVGHIDIGTYTSFSFPITITVTEEYADNELGYYDEYGDFIYYETYEEEAEYSEDSEDGSEDGYDDGSDEDYDYWYSEDEGGNDEYYGYDAAGPEGEDVQYNEEW